MGFSVTASHAILLITFLVAGATLGAVVVSSTGEVDARHRDAVRARAAYAHTTMTFDETGFPVYDAVAETYEVQLVNDGDTVLKASRLTFLLDGVYWSDRIASGPTVAGDPTTDLWMRGQTLRVTFSSVTAEPDLFAAYAENGASVLWRRA